MDALTVDWRAKAREIVERRFPRAAQDRDEGLRAWRHLAGRGFAGGDIRAALSGSGLDDEFD